jgi:hypothetical protein
MSKKEQVNKNIDLSEKLADYLAKNPKEMDEMPKKVSFVAFSAKDTKLNEKNEEIVEKLLGEGQTVVKAQETKDSDKPWELATVSP